MIRLNSLYMNPHAEPFIVKLKESSTYLMNKRVLSKALQKLTQSSSSSAIEGAVAPFTAGDCKTVLVACVNTNDVELTDKLLELLHSRKLLTSNLLYVGIRYACKKKVSLIAYKLLLACSNYNVQTDIDTVNEVIRCLTINGDVNEAFDVLERLNERDFGKEVVGDVTSYIQLISYGRRSFKAHVSSILRALSLMEKNPAVTPDVVLSSTPLGDNLFISALKICNFAGDYVSASKIFKTYQNYFGIVQVKAYNIFFLVYINGCNNEERSSTELPESSEEMKANARKMYLEIITHVTDFNMDSSPVLANSILRFYCASKELEKAEKYFNRLKSLKHSLYASTIIDFGTLIRHHDDLKLASEFYNYLIQSGYFPPPYLSVMAYEYELECKQLKNMISLLNSDSFLPRDSTSVAKSCLLAIHLGHYKIAHNIFTDIFLMLKSLNVEHSDRQYCFCLLTIIESVLSHIPVDEPDYGMWIEELIHSFVALDFKSYKVDRNVNDTDFVTVDYLGSSEKGSMQQLFHSPYFESLISLENKGLENSQADTRRNKMMPHVWRLNEFTKKEGLDEEDGGVLSLSWYRFRMAGYMIIADALLARRELLLALDTLDFMLKDTRRQRKNVSVKNGSPCLRGVMSADYINSVFATLYEENIDDKLCKGIKRRLIVNTSKNFELSKIRNCNVRNVDVKIKLMNFGDLQDIEEVKKEVSVTLSRALYRISKMITVSDLPNDMISEGENQNSANLSRV